MTENFGDNEIRIMKQLETFDLSRVSLYGLIRDDDILEETLNSLQTEGYIRYNEKKKVYSLTDEGKKMWNEIVHLDLKSEIPKKMEWSPDPDTDAYMLMTNERVTYYYGVRADLKLNGQGNFFYKESEDGELTPSSEEEVLNILRNRPEEIAHKCPCLTIMPNGHLRPLIDRSGVKQ